MHPLRTSRHLLQLVQKSALPEVSGRSSRSLARSASPGASPNALRPCGLHASSSFGSVGLAEQEGPLRPPVSHQCGNPSGSRARSPASRCRNRLLQRPAHLDSKTRTSPACTLCGAGRWAVRHGTRWITPRYDFFLPVKVLGAIFRGKFHEALQRAFHDGKLNFQGDLKLLAQPKTFAAWLRPLFRKDWVVYSKRPFGGPEHVLRYLGRYTHRVAISNHRLVSFADGTVTFRWRDSAHSNEQKLMILSLDEFLRRFLLHLLPEGFVRIRNFGFLANRKRATTLPLCFQLLSAAPQTDQEVSTSGPSDLWSCPKCGGPMRIVERLTAAEIQLRSPPVVKAAA